MPIRFSNVNNAKIRNLAENFPIVAFLALTAHFLTLSSYTLYDFPVDDAWIHRVYSRSLAYYGEFFYNDGLFESGFTSPLWVLATAWIHWFEPLAPGKIAFGIKVFGIFLSVGSLVIASKISKKLYRDSSKHHRILTLSAIFLFAMDPRIVFSSLSGMESILLVFLFLVACDLLISEKYLGCALIVSLMGVTRPESLVLIVFFMGAHWYVKRPPLRQLWVWFIATIPFLFWLSYCKIHNDLWLPLTFHLKLGSFNFGVEELFLLFKLQSHHGIFPWWVWAIGLLSFSWMRLGCSSRQAWLAFLGLVGAPFVLLVGVIGTRSISLTGYYWLRWVDPASLMLTFAAALGLAEIAFSSDLHNKLTKKLPVKLSLYNTTLLFLFLAFFLVVSSMPHWLDAVDKKQKHLHQDSKIIHTINVETGKWLAKNTPIDAVIAVNDAGAIRYFSERFVIDMVGLNHKEIALSQLPKQLAWKMADYLALYPSWFKEYDFSNFQLLKVQKVDPQNYTICDCPSQTTLGIFERKRWR